MLTVLMKRQKEIPEIHKLKRYRAAFPCSKFEKGARTGGEIRITGSQIKALRCGLDRYRFLWKGGGRQCLLHCISIRRIRLAVARNQIELRYTEMAIWPRLNARDIRGLIHNCTQASRC